MSGDGDPVIVSKMFLTEQLGWYREQLAPNQGRVFYIEPVNAKYSQ